jgi:hypothetical protein
LNFNFLDGACKYGDTCTFAHGDQEVRSKMENQMGFTSKNMMNMNPMMGMFNPYMMDPMFLGMQIPLGGGNLFMCVTKI